jgi:hypothetical protein
MLWMIELKGKRWQVPDEKEAGPYATGFMKILTMAGRQPG